MRKFLAGIGVVLLINCIWIFVRGGISNTFLLNIGIFAAVGFYTAFYERLIKLKWLTATLAIFIVLYGSLGAFAFIYGRVDSVTFNEDVAIILGNGLRGEEVSSGLQSRLAAGLEYHSQNPSALIIVSGGQGPGDIITEALAMARYLEVAGVPPHLIIQEGQSNSTHQNIYYSMEILEEIFPNGYTAVIITNEFHIYRALGFTRILGMEHTNSMHGQTPILTLPGMLVREVAAIIKMWILGT